MSCSGSLFSSKRYLIVNTLAGQFVVKSVRGQSNLTTELLLNC